MKKINFTTELEESILLLEVKQANEEALLKEHFKLTYDSLKPMSLIKNTLDGLTNLSNFKGNITDTSLSLVAGYISKKIIFGSTQNPLKQLLGSLLQVGVTSMASKNADNIRSFITRVKTNILTKNDEPS